MVLTPRHSSRCLPRPPSTFPAPASWRAASRRSRSYAGVLRSGRLIGQGYLHHPVGQLRDTVPVPWCPRLGEAFGPPGS